MRRVLDGFYRGCMILSCASILIIVAVVFIQVALNIVDWGAEQLGLPGLGLMIPSYSMFAGYGLAFATFLALGPALRQGVHIRVTLLHSQMTARVQRCLFVFISCVGVISAVMITWALCSMAYESWEFGDKSSGLVPVLLWIPQSVLCFGAVAFLVACLDLLIEAIVTGREPIHSETLLKEGSR